MLQETKIEIMNDLIVKVWGKALKSLDFSPFVWSGWRNPYDLE